MLYYSSEAASCSTNHHFLTYLMYGCLLMGYLHFLLYLIIACVIASLCYIRRHTLKHKQQGTMRILQSLSKLKLQGLLGKEEECSICWSGYD